MNEINYKVLVAGKFVITNIPEILADLNSLSFTIAMALVIFLCTIEVIRQNLEAFEGNASYANFVKRLVLVFMGIILYKRIFMFFLEASFIFENAVLSFDQWADFINEVGNKGNTLDISFMSFISKAFIWFSSFGGIMAIIILEWIRFVFLCLLYFVGPVVFVFGLYQPTANWVKGWFLNVISVCLWVPAVRVVVRILFELNVYEQMVSANQVNGDTPTLFIFNTLFLVMTFFSPVVVSVFLRGQSLSNFSSSAMSTLYSGGNMALQRITQNLSKVKIVRQTGKQNLILKEKDGNQKTKVS